LHTFPFRKNLAVAAMPSVTKVFGMVSKRFIASFFAPFIAGVASLSLLGCGGGGSSAAPAAEGRARAEAQTVNYLPSDDNIPNPERGTIIQHQPVGSNGRVENREPLRDEGVMAYFVRERERTGATTARVVYVLADWKTVDLPPSFLDRLQSDFDAARDNGFKLIPYFVYSWSEDLDQAAARDASADWTVRHLAQLAPLLQRNQDVLALMIAGLVGAWGEWHSSSSGNVTADGDVNDNSRRIYGALMQATPPERSVVLRYTSLKRQLVGETALSEAESFTGTDRARTGFHDEGLLQNKWGTDVDFDWYDAYIRAEGRFTPSVETFDSNTLRDGTEATCAALYAELARRGADFANDMQDRERLQPGCEDEVRRRVGYRLRLEETTLPAAARAGDGLAVQLKLRNDGWSPLFNARPVLLVLREQTSGQRVEFALPTDPRRWSAGAQTVVDAAVTLPADLPAGRYDWLLELPDAAASLRGRSAYAIRLANRDLWEPDTGANKLLQALNIVR
jgi:hypothetical protein